jgi:hypothetical protein
MAYNLYFSLCYVTQNTDWANITILGAPLYNLVPRLFPLITWESSWQVDRVPYYHTQWRIPRPFRAYVHSLRFTDQLNFADQLADHFQSIYRQVTVFRSSIKFFTPRFVSSAVRREPRVVVRVMCDAGLSSTNQKAPFTLRTWDYGREKITTFIQGLSFVDKYWREFILSKFLISNLRTCNVAC